VDALDLVVTWLQAVEADDWQTVWECHAPDSLILAAHQVIPRQVVPPDVFAQCQRTITEHQPLDARLRFRGRRAELVPLPETAVVMVDLTEGRSGRACRAAFVVGRTGITGIVADPASPEAAAVEAAADLAQVPGALDWSMMHLSALHHSFARRCVGLPLPVRALPDQRFTCQGRGECCRVGKWQVPVSDNERLAADDLLTKLHLPALTLREPAETPGFPSPAAMDLRHFLAPDPATGACGLLDEDRHCRLHGRLGWQPIPVCQTYPVFGIATPDSLDVTAYYSCQTVCENTGERLQDQAPALQQRFWPLQNRLRRIPAHLPMANGLPVTMAWEDYRDIETRLLAHLADLPAAGAAALADGSAYLADILEGYSSSAAWSVAATLMVLLKPLPPGGDWKGGWLGGAYQEAWQAVDRSDVRYVSDGEMVSRFLRSVLFRKPGLPEAGVGHAWGVTLLVQRMVVEDARFRALRAGRQATEAADVLAAIRATETLVGHARLAHAVHGLPDDPMESPAVWAALIGA
jgi:hypothetical protein